MEILFENVQEVFWKKKFRPEEDSKKFRFKVSVMVLDDYSIINDSYEDEEEDKPKLPLDNGIIIQVEILKLLDAPNKYCVEFKRLSGDPFDFVKFFE